MRVLIIGGTRFLGRHLVVALLHGGHEVVLFNRGRTNPELFPELERIAGDRAGPDAFASLAGRRFDVVVDTCGFAARDVRASASALRAVAERYAFVSSVSVYDSTQSPLDEAAAVLALPDGSDPDGYAVEWYGACKAMCERAARQTFGDDRTLVVRPGLIVGPHDPTDRFTYWPARIARGGDVLAPHDPAFPFQAIDARDVAAFLVLAVERAFTGTYNVDGEPGRVTLGDVFARCARNAEAPVNLVWVDEAFLAAAGVEGWVEIPLWVPSAEAANFFAVDVSKAARAGLRTRSLDETVADTLAWSRTRDVAHPWKAGLDPERERALLARWRSREA